MTQQDKANVAALLALLGVGLLSIAMGWTQLGDMASGGLAIHSWWWWRSQ